MKIRLVSIFAFTVLVSFVTSCKDKEIETSTEEVSKKEVVTATQETEEDLSAIAEDAAAVEGEEDYDDPTIFPTSFKFKHDLIMTGEYHDGEIVLDVDNKSWVGLVKETDDTYSVYKLNPTTKKVHDVVLDETGEMTGTKVSVKSVGEVMFMTNEGLLTKGTDLASVELPKTIYPGESKDFSYKGKAYTIYAEGEKDQPYNYENNEGEQIRAYNIKKYSLYLKIKGQNTVIKLLDLNSLEEATPTIEFAGDLNGDGIVDFLINTTYNYNMSRPTLYLSEGKTGSVNVKAVAALTSLGC